MRAWHWLREEMTSGYGNESAWTEGEARTVTGKIALCERGYHASPSPWAGLEYVMKDKQIVIVLTEKQAAALCIAASTALLSGDLPLPFVPDVCEAVAVINQAAGNPSPPGFADALAKVREQLGLIDGAA